MVSSRDERVKTREIIISFEIQELWKIRCIEFAYFITDFCYLIHQTGLRANLESPDYHAYHLMKQNEEQNVIPNYILFYLTYTVTSKNVWEKTRIRPFLMFYACVTGVGCKYRISVSQTSEEPWLIMRCKGDCVSRKMTNVGLFLLCHLKQI